MDKQYVLNLIKSETYYDIDDLRYNKNIGLCFSKEQLNEFLDIKDNLVEENNKCCIKLPLKTFNSKHCFYVDGSYLRSVYKDYLTVLIKDFEENKQFLFNRHNKNIMLAKIFSEVEGTLSIENVSTTHRKIKEIFESEKLSNHNDIIIKNMKDAITFIVNEKPVFNKENLFKLYTLLSRDCLKKDDCLKKGYFYRDDVVYVGGYDGADADKIDEMMDGLFAFVNNKDSLKQHKILLPLICHYYILYVHPYFDYNGRTARMVSFWISYIFEIEEAPLFISEAINEEKNKYYKAIVNTRNTNNDLTYFFGYVLETAIKYSLIYKNVEEIKNILSQNGDILTSSEEMYLKKIIIHNSTGFFNYKMFLQYINSTMSRPGCMKILHRLTEYNILIMSKNKRNDTIFQLNQDMLKFKC